MAIIGFLLGSRCLPPTHLVARRCPQSIAWRASQSSRARMPRQRSAVLELGVARNQISSNASDEVEPSDELQPPRSLVASIAAIEGWRGWAAVEMGAEPGESGDEGPP